MPRGKAWIDFDSGQGQVASSCGNSNEPSGPIKREEFLDSLID